MHFTINSATVTASISSVGAELQSLRQGTRETLWQGDPNVWSGRAPILFPIVGALKNSEFNWQGKRFELPRHGFARKAEFTCIKHNSNEVVLQLVADSSSLAVYPWQFVLTVSFSLQENNLVVRYMVANQDNNPMLFTIGSHPAFALQQPTTEYSIHFSQAETLKRFPLTDDGLLQPGVDYLQNSQLVPLNDNIFNADALIFKDIKSRVISLHQQGKPLLSVDTGGAPHLGLWAKPAASFVCIEPWFGFSDHADCSGNIEDKPAMHTLAAGEQFDYKWMISLH